MTKITKQKKAKMAGKLNTVAKGRIKKPKMDKKSAKLKGKQKRVKVDTLENPDSELIIKKKPCKADLKMVLEILKREPTLITMRKALKYIPFYLKSEALTKKLLKEVIRLWAEAGEKIRVICLLCLIRIFTKLKEEEKKQLIVKNLYSSFMEKCRVTKQETMSMISFMRHSLIELCKLSPKIAFKQAQTSCQQLCITLKNAQTHKNEETQKTVLNWQFANCLILLSSLITSHKEDKLIKSLTNQVIQLNLDAINLMTSPRYYPYYCHLIENLIGISIAMNTFIPVLPILLKIHDKLHIPFEKKREINGADSKASNGKSKGKRPSKLNDVSDDDDDDDNEESAESDDHNGSDEEDKNSSSSSDIFDDRQDDIKKKKKEYNMDLLNHVSLDEAHSLEYQVAVLDRVYELTLRYLASQCHRIAFPELVLLPCVQIRKWLRRNRSTQCQKFKTLLEKIKADCEKIEAARMSVDFEFTNYAAVDAWEKRMNDSGRLSLTRMASIATN